MQNILRNAVKAIEHLSDLKDHELCRCSYGFEIDQNKRISKRDFTGLVNSKLESFDQWVLENISELRLYDFPMARILCVRPPLDQKTYKLRSHLKNVHSTICSRIISISGQLFETYKIDLGIKHPHLPRDVPFESVDIRSLLAQLKALLTTFIEIINTLIRRRWFDGADFAINSGNISELLRLIQQVLNSAEEMSADDARPLEEIDGLVNNCLVLVERYREFEEEARRHEHKELRAREQQHQVEEQKRLRETRRPREKKRKVKHRSVVEISTGGVNPRQEDDNLEKVVARKSPRKRRHKKSSKNPCNIALALQDLLLSVLSQPYAILSNQTVQHLLIFLAENIMKRASKRLKLSL